MLVRVLLIVDDASLERRLDRVFEPLDTAVATAPHDAMLWDRVKAVPADLVVTDRSSLPDPIEGTVETSQRRPERPEVIVVGSCEQAHFAERLPETNGSVDETARRSGINPRSLYDLMKRHGLRKEAFRIGGEK